MQNGDMRVMRDSEKIVVDGLEITRNDEGGLFVEDPETTVEIRIRKLDGGGIKFTVLSHILADIHVETDWLHQMNGWKIVPRPIRRA